MRTAQIVSFGAAVAAMFVGSLLAATEGPGTYFEPPKGTANVTVSAAERPGAIRKTVAFLGGSITEMNGFRPRVMKALREKYPQVDFVEIAAGLSSTCSDAGAFRLEEDVLAKGTPDLFIVEAAVNDDQDGHFTPEHSVRGMEGAVRHVLTRNPSCAVVVALMVNRGQFRTRTSGRRSRCPRSPAGWAGRNTATATPRRPDATLARRWSWRPPQVYLIH